MLRFAHISDLHFSHFSLNPLQIFSKRWVGNLNLFLNRKKKFDPATPYALIPLFQTLKLDAVLITGDLTSTTHPKELTKAKEYVQALRSAGLEVILIPGNHDHYTKSAYNRLDFYRVFNDHALSASLKEQRLGKLDLGNNWSLIALDCACATPLFSSHGVFSQEMEQRLQQLFSTLSSREKVILMNHFPFFEMERKKSLERSKQLFTLIQRYPQIKLYLHGHTHRHIIADLRKSALPIIADSGCTAYRPCPTWNLIDIREQGCDITVYKEIQRGREVRFEW